MSPNSPSTPEDVKVTLLLSGGHEYATFISPDAPLLRELFEVVLEPDNNRGRVLFQIPVHKGRGMLCFPSDRLMGLVTEPPIIVQQPSPESPQQFPQQSLQQSLQQSPQPSPRPAQAIPPKNALLSDYLHLDHFLPPEQYQSLLDYAIQKEAEFVTTNTSTGELNYRRSVVLHSFPEFSNLICQHIQEVFPQVLSKLDIPDFGISQVETQLTAHNDGNYYKVHNDNGSVDTATRELTYVYYFYREPKAFSGGELRIYDSRIENNFYVQAESFHTVEPRNNSIVFFRSRYMHEVLPIACPSRAFADSRFTINGWIRR